MNQKTKKQIAVVAAALAICLAAMLIIYHFFGPQTKLKDPVTTTVETTLEDITEPEEESALDETETEEDTEAEAQTDNAETKAETEKETSKKPSKKPETKPSKPAVKPSKPAETKPVPTTEKQTQAPTTEKQGISLTIEVILPDGTKKVHNIKTDANNLGDALVESGIAKGDKTQYGLFITTVDGIKADEKKQQWWFISKNGVGLQTGADLAPIADGDKFELTLKEGYDM